jgi:hypothetical protein
VAAGLAVAMAAVQLVQSLLFGVDPHDPLTLLAPPGIVDRRRGRRLPAAGRARRTRRSDDRVAC